MNAELAKLIARHTITTFGGAYLAKYGIDDVTVDTVIGALITLIGFGLSAYDKRDR